MNKKIIITTSYLVLALSILSTFLYLSWLNQTDYWGTAPNGTYLVFISGEIENHQIWFPICDHSGGNLHGSWSVAKDVTLPVSIAWHNETNAIIDMYQNGTAIYGTRNYRYGYALATLENNIIIKLEGK